MNFLLSEARFYFAQCVFTGKCHYCAVAEYSKKRNGRQGWAIGIAIVSLLVLVGTIICREHDWQVVLGIFSTLGLFSTAAALVFEFFNREDLTEFCCYHKQAAEDYYSLRDRLMDVIRQILSGTPKGNVEVVLQQCLHDYNMIGKYALQTSHQNYLDTQKALGLHGQGEEFTWSNDEIDKFLPEGLRIRHIPEV